MGHAASTLSTARSLGTAAGFFGSPCATSAVSAPATSAVVNNVELMSRRVVMSRSSRVALIAHHRVHFLGRGAIAARDLGWHGECFISIT